PTGPGARPCGTSGGCWRRNRSRPDARPVTARPQLFFCSAAFFCSALNAATLRWCSWKSAVKRVSPGLTVTKYSQSPGVGLIAARTAASPGLSIGVGGRPMRSYELYGLSVLVSVAVVLIEERLRA